MASCTFKAIPLPPQAYAVRMGGREANGSSLITESKDVAYFTVMGKMADYGLMGDAADAFTSDFPNLVLPYEWHFSSSGGVPTPVELKLRQSAPADELAQVTARSPTT